MKPSSCLESGRLASFRSVVGLSLLLGAAGVVHAANPPVATATITDTAVGGGEFDYTVTVDNTSTGPLGTFWYSWVPGEDFLATSPTDVVSPANFTDNITHGGSTDGYAIQWIASTPLAGGATEKFSFESTETPTALAGDSPFYTTTPQDTAFAYSGAPFSDAGDEFIVKTAVVAPEPSTVAELFAGGLGLLYLARRRRTQRCCVS
jgi:hypothetical protein